MEALIIGLVAVFMIAALAVALLIYKVDTSSPEEVEPLSMYIELCSFEEKKHKDIEHPGKRYVRIAREYDERILKLELSLEECRRSTDGSVIHDLAEVYLIRREVKKLYEDRQNALREVMKEYRLFQEGLVEEKNQNQN